MPNCATETFKYNDKHIHICKHIGGYGMDISIYCVIIIAIIFRLIIMKGSFILPTFYKNGNEVSFNLGSIITVIIGVLASIGLAYAQPDLFANPYVAFVTAYTAPQITDGIITAGTRYAQGSTPAEEKNIVEDEEDTVEIIEEEGQ